MTGSNEQIGKVGNACTASDISAAAARLRAGELVVVPTETVYGLAADATNASAVAAIYRTKGRPDFNPLIVHVASLEDGQRLARFNPLAMTLVAQFWPGPLTLVLPKRPDCPVASAVTAGLETIALRCPAHPIMRQLLTESGLYLAAPSANRSGRISPTRAEHVAQGLGSGAPMILDGGPCDQGLESTIIAIRDNQYDILRPGPITRQELIEVTGQAPMAEGGDKIEAPGQLASHYAPSKPVRLNARDAEPEEFLIGFGNVGGNFNLSETGDLAEAAAHLFSALHIADADQKPMIAVTAIPDEGIGAAINDRLKRAASRT